MPAQGCELNYQVRTKTGEGFGQLTAACPHRGASNSVLRVTWTIRFGLSQARDSSLQHARTGVWIELYQVRTKSGEDFGQLTAACPRRGASNSLLRVTWTIRFGLSQGRDSSQQHARTGGIKLSLTCKLHYLRFGLSQGRSSDSSQQHARTGGVKLSLTYELNYQVRTKSGEVIGHNAGSTQQHARIGGVKLSLMWAFNFLMYNIVTAEATHISFAISRHLCPGTSPHKTASTYYSCIVPIPMYRMCILMYRMCICARPCSCNVRVHMTQQRHSSVASLKTCQTCQVALNGPKS